MEMKNGPSLGEIAYEHYRAHSGGLSLATGATIPEWGQMRQVIRNGWEAAASAVAKAVAPRINELTGTNQRLIPPQLNDEEVHAVAAAARFHAPDHVNLFGREYWADPDNKVYVVAWRDPNGVSGDRID